jgi:EpsI family protein
MAWLFSNRFVQVFTVILGLQAVLFYTALHGDARPLAHPLADFPSKLGDWMRVADIPVDDDTKSVLRADDILSRFYVRATNPDLPLTPAQEEALVAAHQELFIAYFNTQQQGQSPHSPKNCLPGSGWSPVESGEMNVTIPGLAKPLTINKYVIAKGSSESMVLYWYQSHGRVVANEFSAKFFLVADSLRYHRSDTALVRVVTPVLHDDMAGAMDTATNFVQAVFPAVYKYLPM